MKRFFKVVTSCFIVGMMLCGCSSGDSKKDTTKTESTETNEMVGTLVSTTGSKLTLKNNDGDSIVFNTENAKFDLRNGMEAGNWVHIEYTGEIDGTDASNVKVVKVIDDDTNESIKTEQSKVKINDASGTVYAIASVHVRASYTTSSDILGTLTSGEAVTRTGVLDSGWTRISYNGGEGYVCKKYLSETKPNVTTKTNATNTGEEKQTIGKVKQLSNNILTIDHKGLTFVFDISKATQKYTGSLVTGKEVTITFVGDLDGTKTLPASSIEDAVED